jgi:hypothetical protein
VNSRAAVLLCFEQPSYKQLNIFSTSSECLPFVVFGGTAIIFTFFFNLSFFLGPKCRSEKYSKMKIWIYKLIFLQRYITKCDKYYVRVGKKAYRYISVISMQQLIKLPNNANIRGLIKSSWPDVLSVVRDPN